MFFSMCRRLEITEQAQNTNVPRSCEPDIQIETDGWFHFDMGSSAARGVSAAYGIVALGVLATLLKLH